MAWDEGNAILRAQGILDWIGRWGHAGLFASFSPQAIAAGWRYTNQIEGHPAFYGTVIASGRAVSAAWLAPLDSWRFGPMMLFALAAGALFCRMARDYSLAAATATVSALVLLPRLFAHAHFASFDGPLTSCWILAWAAFAPARESRRWSVLWGTALGMTLSCKATGWIAPWPFLAWSALYRDRRAAGAWMIGILVAMGVFLLLNPPLWHDPLGGWGKFLGMNLNREHFNISTQFLGRLYNLDYPLPWYNTLLWAAITVPIGILLLVLAGLVAVCRDWRSRPAGVLLLANALVLMLVRATPWAPPHDAERLFLPSFAFLAALAGVGCWWILQGRECPSRRSLPCASPLTPDLSPPRGEGGFVTAAGKKGFVTAGRTGRPRGFVRNAAAIVLLYLGSVTSLVCYAPQWLSYYNLAIGGLPGAVRAGMEATYYWDALDRSMLDWLNTHTAEGEKVAFGAGSVENLFLLRQWGILRPEFSPTASGRYRWYVLQWRPSAWQPADYWLVKHASPARRKTISTVGWGPWRLDAPLVEVYSYTDYLEALRLTSPPPQGPSAGNPGQSMLR
jgi:hypothetical protein